MPRWSKITLKIVAALFILILVVFTGIAYYVNSNRDTLLASITKELNKNLNGQLSIQSIDPTLLKGFPRISISLKNVVLRDSLWSRHKHTFLEAKDLDVSVNALAILVGTVEIKKIGINNATIYLFTDSNGYSNTSIFKKKDKKPDPNEEQGDQDMEIGKFTLNNVAFVLDNQKGHKLFQFMVQDLKGDVDYPNSGWKADVELKTLAKNLAFNTRRGSFIKDKLLEGPFDISYNNDTQTITVAPNTLNIGSDPFIIGAKFNLSKDPSEFVINIEAKDILWKNASALLAPNISSRLNMVNLSKPINVECDIVGDMGSGGDPLLNVVASVKDNELSTPGGTVKDCNFTGVFTNNYINGKGLNDANSAIKLYKFKGNYEEMPFSIDTAFINNLEKPIATGLFKSKFDVRKLNNVIGAELLKFTKGSADVQLAYSADIVDFMLTKPRVAGFVKVKNADMSYVPRKLNFKNTSLSLNFKNNDLFISNVRLQSGKSIVLMEGSIKNFMNLYYTAPEKILLSWQIRSPQIHLGEFLGFFGKRVPEPKKRTHKSNFSDDLNEIFAKSNVAMNIKVDKVYYNRFLATNAVAELLLTESNILIRNVGVKHAGGSLKLNGKVTQQGSRNNFAISSQLSNVDISHFLYSFNDFGMKSLSSKNLKGYLFSRINISGAITDQGKLLSQTLIGDMVFDLKKGALLNFEPVKNVGKFAFPMRDLDNIAFNNLNGKFDIRGDQITINPMQINTSLLNMNIAGIYSFNRGTNITLDVPLRNPKKDEDLTDRQEIKDRRMKGIVLHLLATDGEDGKIKIKLNRNREKGTK
jgi:hypothetical protein